MKLETVSKVKGWVALLGLGWLVFAAFTFTPDEVRGRPGLLAGFAGIAGIVYAVKWIRLRRFMRTAEYAGRVLRNG